ncbi:MAG: ABC transporter ATP-binding protein [Thermoproteota archaeon]
MIIAENLSKFFGRVKALENLSVKMPNGVNGLIGPNGAGKTTLIHVLTGLIKPDSGEVEVMGLEPWSQRYELMKRMSVLLERPVFPLGLTGFRYILHVARVMGLSEKEAVEALRKTGILDAAERKIAGYSAGMNVRLGIAKAILGNPELVVLDEPTANLDPQGRIDLLRLIRRMHRDNNVSFLVSSHVLPELQKVCSWVCLMYEGRAVEQGFVNDLLDKYSSKVYAIRVSKPGELVDALKTFKDIRVKIVDNTVYVKDDSNILRELPRLISQTDNEILSFHQLGRSLESVFIRALEGMRHETT